MRDTPNKKSIILKHAVIGGAGLGSPPAIEPPSGMAAILLYVPLDQVVNKTPIEIQDDLGLPWHMDDGESVWFEEFAK